MTLLSWSLQHKRATAAQWVTANTVLLAGQEGIETDTNKFKIGNGTSAWLSLPYFVDVDYINTLLTTVIRDRGTFDASVNTFPSTGGSGAGGSVELGNQWTISVNGTIGGEAVTAPYDIVRALVNNPGNVRANWYIQHSSASGGAVDSVNGQTGTVVLTHLHVGADQSGSAAAALVSANLYTDSGLATKQVTLVSGTNIKTVNGASLLGSGNIAVGGSGTILGSVAATAGLIPYGTGVLDTVTSSAAFKVTNSGGISRITIDGLGVSAPSFELNSPGFGNFLFEMSGDDVYQTTSATYPGDFIFRPGGTEHVRFATSGISIKTGATPTAYLHIAAGTATVNTAPLKLTSGTNLTTPEVGAVEYNNTFHLTNSDGTRRHIVTAISSAKTPAFPTADGYIVVNIGGVNVSLLTGS